jgi:3-methyladenine DNA glycosylase AlkD
MRAREAKKELAKFSSKKKAAIQQGFFKTGPGEYGEGDIFIGARVPEIRSVARDFADLNRRETTTLLKSKIHEERLLALLILVQQFAKGTKADRKSIYDFYLAHARWINNWDLVDLSADKIVGEYLMERSRNPLYKLARSKILWERRIAMIATYTFIKNGDLGDTFCLSAQLLADEHDLMHKACGWMLREAGKKDEKALETFLKEFGSQMPRTMLRYAIERLPEKKRKFYLNSTK